MPWDDDWAWRSEMLACHIKVVDHFLLGFMILGRCTDHTRWQLAGFWGRSAGKKHEILSQSITSCKEVHTLIFLETTAATVSSHKCFQQFWCNQVKTSLQGQDHHQKTNLPVVFHCDSMPSLTHEAAKIDKSGLNYNTGIQPTFMFSAIIQYCHHWNNYYWPSYKLAAIFSLSIHILGRCLNPWHYECHM